MNGKKELKKVILHRVAHARCGDKGNRLNIVVYPYEENAYPYLVEQLTAERIENLFKHRGAENVVRYELPNVQGLNFVIDNVLEGGVNGSLNLDGHGKTHSSRLLALMVEVPESVIR